MARTHTKRTIHQHLTKQEKPTPLYLSREPSILFDLIVIPDDRGDYVIYTFQFFLVLLKAYNEVWYPRALHVALSVLFSLIEFNERFESAKVIEVFFQFFLV